jgi:hypothetical protein
MARLWLEATWFLALGVLSTYFQDEVSGSFFGYFIAGGLFFQRVSNRETEELTRSVDDLEAGAAAVVRQWDS